MDKNEALMQGRMAKLDASFGILPESGRRGSVRGAGGQFACFYAARPTGRERVRGRICVRTCVQS
ncbi:protein of unknown function [Paraburkholderia dioscoreae]|uniref:Uncharacterized protein n=1 Tax=Paraburkholderia dioscoreae TaxID=2604047 RepID=A0A5Q4ZE69_9BURK|nr:protein of unknown function [Paraburkholderia dioscoreae]